ncbi:hypothetical protein KP509_07G061800 [Ceratopteris richardii]|uniref:Pentatricopeptide repeat-containing protein n=1 Tax=Ceratopteris richardii TaxID=49495 RepID=A0A8T2UIB9_CERRI|nr:hypothetical protein KP509_07G061800 [Ceratopteris richardii]
MYAKCGDFSKAQDVLQNLPFRDVGQAEQALKCFHRMQHEGIRPNAVTYACILKAYAALGALNEGKKIHDVVKNQGLLQNNVELGTALVDMYAKCGALSKAKCVFDSLLHRDVVCWNALIVGYMHDGQGERALDCFKRMKHDGITPDATTYACMLKACASIGACDEGQKIHDEIERQGLLEVDIMCGKLSKAQEVLHQLPFRDVVSWNALITGFAQGGLGEQALSCFEKMQSEGISPDAVSFLCILNVCSHLGLVDKGYEYFVNMTTKYGIIPNSECFTCIIDLFGREGHLEKAVQLIQEMPVFDRSANWIALLSASHKWGDIKVGRLAYEQASQVDKMHGPAVLLMANMYSSAEGGGDEGSPGDEEGGGNSHLSLLVDNIGRVFSLLQQYLLFLDLHFGGE